MEIHLTAVPDRANVWPVNFNVNLLLSKALLLSGAAVGV
jgi:hypothetical protein